MESMTIEQLREYCFGDDDSGLNYVIVDVPEALLKDADDNINAEYFYSSRYWGGYIDGYKAATGHPPVTVKCAVIFHDDSTYAEPVCPMERVVSLVGVPESASGFGRFG